ncbi:MAG: SHOCT domain-containing protein [Thermodesulfovibrionales bacterium]
MHWGDYGWGMGNGWGMGFGWLLMIIFWLLIIFGVVYLIKLIAGGGKKEQLEEAPLDILKKRYAKGEISREEFEKIREDLTKS